jgi:8-oxo-(d)GTP phosphatase
VNEPGSPIVVRQVSAGGVVVGTDRRIVVVSQKGTSWSLPKGGVHPGEDHLAAARREVLEETGLSLLDLVQPLAPYDRSPLRKPHHVKTLVFFLFRTEETLLAPQDPDNPVALWLPPREAVDRLSHPRDRQFLADVVREHDLA